MRQINVMVSFDNLSKFHKDFYAWDKGRGTALIQNTQHPKTTNTSSPILFTFFGDNSFFTQFPHWEEYK